MPPLGGNSVTRRSCRPPPPPPPPPWGKGTQPERIGSPCIHASMHPCIHLYNGRGRRPCGVGTRSLVALAGGRANKTFRNIAEGFCNIIAAGVGGGTQPGRGSGQCLPAMSRLRNIYVSDHLTFTFMYRIILYCLVLYYILESAPRLYIYIYIYIYR